MEDYPAFEKNKFICPHCSTLAKQDWFESNMLSNIIYNIYEQSFLSYRKNIRDYQQETIASFLKFMQIEFPKSINMYFPSNFSIAKCQSCNNFSVWVNKDIIYPKHIFIDTPNEDMNDDIKELYLEAAKIFIDSPKGATAILRLALQKLLVQMGKDGKNINKNIKELVSDGLNPKIQQALDFLRVVGNNAVHPGQIDVNDNKDIALKLFKILNMIADDMITKPKEMENLYNDIIPDEIKSHINDRDKN